MCGNGLCGAVERGVQQGIVASCLDPPDLAGNRRRGTAAQPRDLPYPHPPRGVGQIGPSRAGQIETSKMFRTTMPSETTTVQPVSNFGPNWIT